MFRLGALACFLGRSLAVFRPLGLLLGALGPLLGARGRLLEGSWTALGRILGGSWVVLNASWVVLEASWRDFDGIKDHVMSKNVLEAVF